MSLEMVYIRVKGRIHMWGIHEMPRVEKLLSRCRNQVPAVLGCDQSASLTIKFDQYACRRFGVVDFQVGRDRRWEEGTT